VKKFLKNFVQVSQNLGPRFANFAEIWESGTKKLAIAGKGVNRAECSYRTLHTKGLKKSLGEKNFQKFLMAWPESWSAFCQFWAKPWGGSLNIDGSIREMFDRRKGEFSSNQRGPCRMIFSPSSWHSRTSCRAC